MHSNYKYPLLGFRVWRYKNNCLYALTKNSTWKSGVNKAVCLKSDIDHTAPNQGCQCGFNAFYFLPEELVKETTDLDYIIWGTVAGAGSIQLKTHGWHSQEAQIISLFIKANVISKENQESLSGSYSVPVFDSLQSWQEFSKNFAKEINSKEIIEVIKKETSDLIQITNNNFVTGKSIPLQYIGKTESGEEALKKWMPSTF